MNDCQHDYKIIKDVADQKMFLHAIEVEIRGKVRFQLKDFGIFFYPIKCRGQIIQIAVCSLASPFFDRKLFDHQEIVEGSPSQLDSGSSSTATHSAPFFIN